MVPHDNVVSDMDKVVDLGSLAYDSRSERGAVNGCVGPDLHVVMDNDIADLQDFAVPSFIEHVTVAVRPDDSAGVDRHTMADL